MKTYIILLLVIFGVLIFSIAHAQTNNLTPSDSVKNLAFVVDSYTCTGPERRALENSLRIVATCVQFYNENWKPAIVPLEKPDVVSLEKPAK